MTIIEAIRKYKAENGIPPLQREIVAGKIRRYYNPECQRLDYELPGERSE
jgi:hypothetical protein